MEITENMLYGVGHIALAIARADGKVNREELKAINSKIMEIAEEANIDLGLIESTFLQYERSTSFSTKELMEEGIRNFHLGDSHLTPKLADLFLKILLEVAKARGPIEKEEKVILDDFMQYLTDRKQQAIRRSQGYIKSILIPVNFEEASESVVSRVKDLENWLKSGFKVTLLHCISPDDLHGTSYEEKRIEAKNCLEDLVAKYIFDKNQKEMVEIDVINDRLEYLDQNYLSRRSFDFVIMGTEGKSEEDFKKSTHTSEHIQRHFANYVVLPMAARIKPIKKIAICTDYKHESFQQFVLVKELCNANEAEVTLVNVQDGALSAEQQEKRDELKRYFKTTNVETLSLHQTVHNEILEYTEANDFDLLVLLPMHTAFFEKFDGHQSVVKKMVQLSKTPVMVLNPEKQSTETEDLVLKAT